MALQPRAYAAEDRLGITALVIPHDKPWRTGWTEGGQRFNSGIARRLRVSAPAGSLVSEDVSGRHSGIDDDGVTLYLGRHSTPSIAKAQQSTSARKSAH